MIRAEMEDVAKAVKHMTFEEFSADLAGVLNRVARDEESVVVEREGLAVLISLVRTEAEEVPADAGVIDRVRGAAGSLPHPLSWQEMRRIAYEDRLLPKFKTNT